MKEISQGKEGSLEGRREAREISLREILGLGGFAHPLLNQEERKLCKGKEDKVHFLEMLSDSASLESSITISQKQIARVVHITH